MLIFKISVKQSWKQSAEYLTELQFSRHIKRKTGLRDDPRAGRVNGCWGRALEGVSSTWILRFPAHWEDRSAMTVAQVRSAPGSLVVWSKGRWGARELPVDWQGLVPASPPHGCILSFLTQSLPPHRLPSSSALFFLITSKNVMCWLRKLTILYPQPDTGLNV